MVGDRVIDYDRGVIINVHPGTGMDVFMYVEQPGQFMTAHGTTVPDQIAREAGYDVDKLSKDRLRMERKAQASALIDQELNDDASTVEQVVKEIGGFSMVSIGLGRFNVKDPDGNKLNANPMAEASAEKLMNAMAGVVVDLDAEANEKVKTKGSAK